MNFIFLLVYRSTYEYIQRQVAMFVDEDCVDSRSDVDDLEHATVYGESI